jgi:hypothetical protein
MGGNVTGCSGVAVVAPRPADVACFLQDRERLDPGALEQDAHGDTRKPSTDDDDWEPSAALSVIDSGRHEISSQEF